MATGPQKSLIRIGVCALTDVLPFIHIDQQRARDLPQATFHGHPIVLKSLRLQCFKEKGLTCAKCGLAGSHFALEIFPGNGQPHMNLYAATPEGDVLMTMDHIRPKAKGGPNHLTNVQTLCGPCNFKKADDFPIDDVERVRANLGRAALERYKGILAEILLSA